MKMSGLWPKANFLLQLFSLWLRLPLPETACYYVIFSCYTFNQL